MRTWSKPQVREQARRLSLTVADKPDSQEICFVPDHDYATFVAKHEPAVVRTGAIEPANRSARSGQCRSH